jgi:hypothetical protein
MADGDAHGYDLEISMIPVNRNDRTTTSSYSPYVN